MKSLPHRGYAETLIWELQHLLKVEAPIVNDSGAKYQLSDGCAVCRAKWPEESSCGSKGKLREAVPELLAVAWKLATAAVPLVTVGAGAMGGATMWVTFTRYVGAFRFVCCTHRQSVLLTIWRGKSLICALHSFQATRYGTPQNRRPLHRAPLLLKACHNHRYG